MAKKRRNASATGSFAGIPHRLMETDDFKVLSGSALKVLMMLLYQFRGKNNGDLSATATMARKWGIGSDQTLSKALKELQRANLIFQTRIGMFLNPGGRCALYALTWLSIDECNGKLDCKPTATPLRKLSLENKLPSTEFVYTTLQNS